MGKTKHLSIKADSDMLDKFYFVSKYYGRSGSGQILFLMRSLIDKFEKEHGEITEDEIRQMYAKKDRS